MNQVITKDFASVIRDARSSAGLTLESLAKLVGTEKGYLSGMERRKVNPPSPKITKKLARALSLDTEELLIYGFVEKAPREVRDVVRAGALREFSQRRNGTEVH